MNWTDFAYALFMPPFWCGLGYALAFLAREPRRRRIAMAVMDAGGPWRLGSVALGGLIANVTAASWAPLAVNCAWIAIAVTWLFWRNRRRDRAPKLAGAKSRARLAALVAKLREAAKPKPSLRPVPGGAR